MKNKYLGDLVYVKESKNALELYIDDEGFIGEHNHISMSPTTIHKFIQFYKEWKESELNPPENLQEEVNKHTELLESHSEKLRIITAAMAEIYKMFQAIK